MGNYPQLEILHITGIDLENTPLMFLVQPPSANIELRHLRELILSLNMPLSDLTDALSTFFHELVIPFSCNVQVPLGDGDSVQIMNALMHKKDGRRCSGEPQVMTFLRVHGHGMQLWPEARTGCLSLNRNKSTPNGLGLAEVRGSMKRLPNVIRRTPAFPLDTIQTLCLLGNPVNARFLVRFAYLRELHLHRSGHKEWLKGIARLPRAALPHLLSLTLDFPKWRTGRRGEPLNAAIDVFLSARRDAGTPIEALHLYRIRGLNGRKALSWLEHMSAELPVFTWTTEEDHASKYTTA